MSMILDIGTSTTKAGMSHDSLPSAVFPTVCGAPVKKTRLLKKKDEAADSGLSAHLIGHDVIHNIGKCTMSYPLEHGIVKDWASMEHLFNHCFTELEQDPEEANVVLTEPPFNPLANKETYAQTIFETFNCESLAFVPQGLCALYASGRTSGIVLDSGDGVTHITPVYDSFIVTSAMNRINFGGKQVSDHLKRLMFERGYNFNNNQDELTLKKIKEETCYVAQDYELEVGVGDEEDDKVDFDLPDGQCIEIAKERFRATEILFDSQILQNELPTTQELVANAVKGCGIDIRKELLANIVLSGGNTMYTGYAKRLKNEVVKQFPGLFGSINVIEAPDRVFSTWAGASVLVNLPTFSANVITRDVYEEEGPEIVHNYQRRTEEEDEEDA